MNYNLRKYLLQTRMQRWYAMADIGIEPAEKTGSTAAMKQIMITFAALYIAGSCHGITEDNAPDSTAATAPRNSIRDNLFYGGFINLSLGNYSVIGIEPMVGYNWDEKLSTGVKVRYDYIHDSRYAKTRTTSSYGGSVFGRYRLTQQFYAQVEPATYNYELFYVNGSSAGREWVPYLFAGGGFRQPLGERSWVFAEIMFDILQDDKSPYDDWTPFFSIGVGAGF
jgi:hypothetical protein